MTDAALEAFTRLFGPEFGHGKAFDLAKLRAALVALGSPHENLPPVIHVAGTNGKGSTIAFMRAIAEAAGLRVHAFTKPHLFQLNERFVVANAAFDDAALIEAAERVHAAAPDLTQFDAQVAAALLLFSEAHADLVLLETGMGGREDSTNVVPRPALTIITPIALDHKDALGATLAEIAAHKAGILKREALAVIARQPDEARAVIEAEAMRVGVLLSRAGVEWDAYAHAGRLIVQTDTRALDLPPPTLAGAHQIENAGLACAALLALPRRDFSSDAFTRGVARAAWPARLQPLMRGAFSTPIRALGGEVWIDGGHNAHAAEALASWLEVQHLRRPAPAIAIIGLRARKDARAFIAPLARAGAAILAAPLSAEHTPPETLAAIARDLGAKSQAALSLAAAMQNAAQLPAPRVLICGSFLLAAEALALENA